MSAARPVSTSQQTGDGDVEPHQPSDIASQMTLSELERRVTRVKFPQRDLLHYIHTTCPKTTELGMIIHGGDGRVPRGSSSS